MNSFVKLDCWVEKDPLWLQLPDAWFRAWMGMNFKASWKESVWWDGKANIIIPPRSFVTSIRKMAAYCRISDQQYRDARDYLQRNKRITFRGTSHWHIVTLLDSDTCEGNSATENKPTDRPGTRERTSREQTENKPRTTVLDVVDVVDVKNVVVAWPLTLEALRAAHHVTDPSGLLENLVKVSREAKPDASDVQIAGAIKATDRADRRGGGLFLKTVPAYLRDHAGEATQQAKIPPAPEACERCRGIDYVEVTDKDGKTGWARCGCPRGEWMRDRDREERAKEPKSNYRIMR
jgi:hypothetical protein